MRLVGMGGAIRINTRSDRMVMVQCVGVVTQESLEVTLDLAWSARRTGRCADYYAGMMIDLREATYIFKAPTHGAITFPSMMREMPTAVIPPAYLVKRFLSCGMKYAAVGVVLGVFTDDGQAQAWAASRARALRAQRAMIRRKLLGKPPHKRAAAAQDLQSDPVIGQDHEREDPASR